MFVHPGHASNMAVMNIYKKIRLCLNNSAGFARSTCSSKDTHTKYIGNETVQNVFIAIKLDCINKQFCNEFLNCNLN
jgi:hypothetical protein